MTAAFLAIGLCTAAAILLSYLLTVSRNAHGMTIGAPRSSAASLPFCPSKRFLLKANRCRRRDKKRAKSPWGVGLTKCQAEDLLDWLEANGRKGQLSFVAGEGFTVR